MVAKSSKSDIKKPQQTNKNPLNYNGKFEFFSRLVKLKILRKDDTDG